MIDSQVLNQARALNVQELSRELWKRIKVEIDAQRLPASLGRMAVYQMVVSLERGEHPWTEDFMAQYDVQGDYYSNFQNVCTEVINRLSGASPASTPVPGGSNLTVPDLVAPPAPHSGTPSPTQVRPSDTPQTEKSLDSAAVPNQESNEAPVQAQTAMPPVQSQQANTEVPATPPSPAQTSPQQEEDLSQISFNDRLIGIVEDKPQSLYISESEEGLMVQWKHHSEGKWVYRVLISDDAYRRPEPRNHAFDLGATQDIYIESTDFRPTSIPNWVTVWRYQIGNEPISSQAPILHAENIFIAEPQEVQAVPAEGQITLSWAPLEGGSTMVYGFSSPEKARSARGRGAEAMEGGEGFLARMEASQTSFVHNGLSEGDRWYYLLYNVSTVEDQYTHQPSNMVSAVTEITAVVPSRLVPPMITEAESRPVPNTDYDDIYAICGNLSGEVKLFTSREPLDPALHEQSKTGPLTWQDVEALAFSDPNGENIPEEYRVPGTIEADGLLHYNNIGWPIGEDALYLTAISFAEFPPLPGTPVCVGNTKQVRRVFPIKKVNFIQHLSWQLLRLQWPEGAHFVEVFHFPHNTEQNTIPEGSMPNTTSKMEDYRRVGGLQLALPCTQEWDVFLRGGTTYNAKNFYSREYKLETCQVWPFSYAFRRVKDNALNKAKDFFMSKFADVPEEYEILLRNDGVDAVALPVQFKVVLSDRAVLDSTNSFDYGTNLSPTDKCNYVGNFTSNTYGNGIIYPVYPNLDKETTEFLSTIPIPALKPKETVAVGFIKLQRKLNLQEVARLRLVPFAVSAKSAEQTKAEPIVAFRRRAASFMGEVTRFS